MNQEKIGNTIKNIRTKNNLTQKEFADSLGVTYQAVSKWENGKNLPDISIMKDISKKYNIDINELLETEEETKNKRNSNLKTIIAIIVSILVVIGIIVGGIIYIKNNNDFKFNTIEASGEDFKISGSIAYNSSKTIIYISDIHYKGEKDTTKYKKISFHLYLSNDNVDQRLFSDEKENITLTDYLESFSMTVNSNICYDFKGKLMLTIQAYDDNNKITNYDIPLELSSTCNKE